VADPPLVTFVAGAPLVDGTLPELVGVDVEEPAPALLDSPVAADGSPPVEEVVEPVVDVEPVAVVDPVEDVDDVGGEELVLPV
jgi:hypothetical protein